MIQNTCFGDLVRWGILITCKGCPPVKSLPTFLWNLILNYLDRASVINLMHTNKEFYSMVEDYFAMQNIYHPRHMPRLKSILNSGYYYHKISNLEIQNMLSKQTESTLILHSAYHSGNILYVRGSFLQEGVYYIEHFHIVPKILEPWRSGNCTEMGQFFLIPTLYAMRRSLARPFYKTHREAMPYIPEQPRKLADLCVTAAASYLTKDKVMTLNLPLVVKNDLFDLCPERHLTDQEIITHINPQGTETNAHFMIRALMAQD